MTADEGVVRKEKVRVRAIRDIVTPIRSIESGRVGTAIGLISGAADGLIAIKWDDDEPYRSMAVAGSDIEFLSSSDEDRTGS